jgi:hypothetical protein
MAVKKFLKLKEIAGSQIFIRSDQILSVRLYPSRDHNNVIHFLTCVRTESGTYYVREMVEEVMRQVWECGATTHRRVMQKLKPQKNTRRMTDAELRGEVF